MRILLAALLIAAAPARAAGIDSIYPPQVLADWQSRVAHFANGVMQTEVVPVLDPAERKRLAGVTFTVPLSAPGHEPLAFWREGDSVHLSAASMHLLGDILVSYAWLGRNKYELSTLDDYMLMLARWRDTAPPPPPRAALFVPDGARDDPGTDELAANLTHDAFLFLMAHELGHVLHDDPGTDALAPAASEAAETAADAFALDVLARIGWAPMGMATFFNLSRAFDPSGPGVASRPMHPLSPARLRMVAADLNANAKRYAGNYTPQTEAKFRLLAQTVQASVDLASDPGNQMFLARRGSTITLADLAPRRPGEIIALPPGRPVQVGPFNGKLAGSVTLGGTAFDAEAVLTAGNGRVQGDFGFGGEFGHLDGTLDGDTLRFAWTSAELRGSGVLRREGDTYQGQAGPAVWALRAVR